MTRRRASQVEDCPFVMLGERKITAAWTNTAGHMRAAQYVVLFEAAINRFLADIGCSDADIARRGAAPVLAEMHVSYARELKAGDRVAITLQVLEIGAQSLHVYMRMAERASGAEAAGVELMILNLDLAARKPRAWSMSQLAMLSVLEESHAELPRPAAVGRAIKAKSGK